MSHNIGCLDSRELCEYSTRTYPVIRDREFIDGLGLGNQYHNYRGDPYFDDTLLRQLAADVKQAAEILREKYESRQKLQQAMNDQLFQRITHPLMDYYACRVWNRSNLSGPRPGKNKKLWYMDDEDNQWIAKNLFCWICRKFASSFRNRNPTNTQPEPPSVIPTKRLLLPYVTRKYGECWIGYSSAFIHDKNSPLNPPTNASSSVDRDQGRDEHATGGSLSSTTEALSELGRKRKSISDKDPGEYRRFQQMRISIDPKATKRRALPKSRGNRSRQHRTPPPFSPLVPRSTNHNISRGALPRATTTATTPAAEEASESDTPPGTPPVASPTTEITVIEEALGDTVALSSQVGVATEHISMPGTPPVVTGELEHTVLGEDEGDIAPPGTTLATMPTTEVTDVEEAMGDIDARHHCSEVTAPETTSAQVEHSNSHRLEAKEGKPKTWDKRKEVRLRKAVFDWLDSKEKDNKEHNANEALQLIRAALGEDRQRLNEIWGTNFESNCERIRGWIDFVLEIQRFISIPDGQDLATSLLANKNNLKADDLHRSKLCHAITNAQTAWYATHPETEPPDLENGLGLLLRDVVFPQKKHQLSKNLGGYLEKLLVGFNNGIELLFTF